MSHRYKRARENAGLSLGQAAKLLRVDTGTLEAIEANGANPAAIGLIANMADTYGVNVEWLTDEAPLHDYKTVDTMRGMDDVSFHDRDVIAEFAASLPRKDPAR